MTAFINRANIAAAPEYVLSTTDTPDDLWPVLGCIRFSPTLSEMAVTEDTPPLAGDSVNNGLRFNALGQLYIWPYDSLGPPDDDLWTGGLPVTSLGQLVVTGDAPAFWNAGWPIALNNYVCMLSTTPPPSETISSIVLTFTPSDGSPINYSQLYYGDSGASADTYYTSKASFLSDNPSIAGLETFASIAPTTGNITFPGGTIAELPTASQLESRTAAAQSATYAAFFSNAFAGPDTITITFSSPVQAAGLNFAYNGGHGTLVLAEFFDGATLLHSQNVPLPLVSPLSNANWGFFGYAVASGGPPATQNRVTGDSDTRITGDGDTRVWV